MKRINMGNIFLYLCTLLKINLFVQQSEAGLPSKGFSALINSPLKILLTQINFH